MKTPKFPKTPANKNVLHSGPASYKYNLHPAHENLLTNTNLPNSNSNSSKTNASGKTAVGIKTIVTCKW